MTDVKYMKIHGNIPASYISNNVGRDCHFILTINALNLVCVVGSRHCDQNFQSPVRSESSS